jgi:hypothetical protein
LPEKILKLPKLEEIPMPELKKRISEVSEK